MWNIIIVKVGSSSLVFPGGRVRRKVIDHIAGQIVLARELGYQVIVVTSGATLIGLAKAPSLASIADEVLRKRIAASVGQPTIAKAWIESFARHGIPAGQVLRTHADIGNGLIITPSVKFMKQYLRRGCVPIVNEDDTRSAEEMRAYINEKGDNDQLACRIARSLRAKHVFLLTDVPGLYDMSVPGKPGRDPIPVIERVTKAVWRMVCDQESGRPTGMRSKLKAADRLQKAGIIAHIADARENVIVPSLLEEQVGTTFPAR